MDTYFINHIFDISKKAYATGITAFSGFLTPEEQNMIVCREKELIPFELFGGAENTERKVARFGNENTADVILPYPISVIKAEPLNKRFSDSLTHRDFLGALMNLGIDRENTGDIVIRENSAYIFVLTGMADYICDNLLKVKHTTVSCEKCDGIPQGELFKTQEKTVIISSLRIDCVLCGVFNMSRSKCDSFFKEKKVFIDSKLIESPGVNVKENSVVSLRGFGKFKVNSVVGNTKKGKNILEVSLYV